MAQFQTLRDFSRGLDLASAIDEVRPGFTPNASNAVINELGGVEKVLGYSALATLTEAGKKLIAYEKSDGSYKRIVSYGSTKWETVTGAGVVASIRTGMTASSQPSWVVFQDALYGMDDNNILGKWDGSSLTTFATGVGTGPNKGRILGVWNGRLYVVPATNQMRIEWSAPFDFTSWPATNYLELNGPGTSNKIVGAVIHAGGMTVFTTVGVHLVPTAGGTDQYVVDGTLGCVSGESLAVLDGVIYGLSKKGVFKTDGSYPLQIVSPLIEPMFVAGSPVLTAAAGVAYRRKYLCSFQRGASANDTTIEDYAALGDAFMVNDYPALAWARTTAIDGYDRLVFLDASDATKLRRAFNGGSFNGAAIPFLYETAPFDMGIPQLQKRLQRVQLYGRGSMTVGVKTDLSDTAREITDTGLGVATGALWDSATWDVSVFGGYMVRQTSARIHARAKIFQLVFNESSTNTFNGRTILKQQSEDVGGAAIYEISPRFEVTGREA